MKNVGLQISEEEYEKLSTLAENRGLSRSLFLRRKLQEIISSSGPFVEGMKLLEELRKTANLLKDLEEKGGEEEDPARLLYHEHYCQLLKLITGINVTPDTAEEEFSRTQGLFPAESGNSVLHAVQSFEPGEISAEDAHAFGIRLACAFCKDSFEAVVATHTDHSHIHNHIVINAVSWKDGNEISANGNSLRKLRKLAAELAPFFGVFKERKVFPKREDNEAQQIIKEVNEAVALSRSFREFRARMGERGYTYSSLEEPALYLHNGKSVVLGEEYSEEVLRERIHEAKSEESRFSFIDVDAGCLHGIQILYFRFLCRLNDPPGGKIPEGFAGMRQKKEQFEEEAYFLIRNGICGKEDLEREKEDRISKHAQCKAEKDALSNQIYRCTKAEKKEYMYEIRDLLKQDCDVLQNEIALCERIEEHTGILEEMLRSYDKVKTKEKDR